jgi:hypothetical protein
VSRESDIGQLDDAGLFGVKLERHLLDRETRRLVFLAREASKRALIELREYREPISEEEAVLVEAAAKKLSAIARLSDSADRIIRGLLAEMRERAKLAVAKPQLTDVEFERHFAEAIRSLSDEDITKIRMTGMQ